MEQYITDSGMAKRKKSNSWWIRKVLESFCHSKLITVNAATISLV